MDKLYELMELMLTVENGRFSVYIVDGKPYFDVHGDIDVSSTNWVAVVEPMRSTSVIAALSAVKENIRSERWRVIGAEKEDMK